MQVLVALPFLSQVVVGTQIQQQALTEAILLVTPITPVAMVQ